MDSVINSFFNTIESGLIMPVASGIWSILPVVLYVAIGITLVSVAFSSSMQRGQKIAGIVGLIVLAVVIHFIPDLVTQAMNGSVDLSSFKAENIADQAQQAASQYSASGSEDTSQGAATLSGLDPDSAEE